MSKECAECGAISDDTYERCPICAADLPRSVVSETRIKMDRRKVFLLGLNQLRFGVLGLIVQAALYVALTPVSFSLFTDGFSQVYSNNTFYAAYTQTMLDDLRLVVVGVIIIAMVVALVVREGFSNLSLVNNTYSIGKTGSLLEFVGLLLLIPGSYLLLSSLGTLSGAYFDSVTFSSVVSNIEIGTTLLIIGAVFGLVGLVMSATAIVRLGVQFGNNAVRVGGFFYFVFGVIGSIILYFGISKIMKKVSHARRYAKAPRRVDFP